MRCSRGGVRPIPFRSCYTLTTTKLLPDHRCAPCFGGCPRAIVPRWIVTHMLVVPTGSLGHPVAILVEVIANNGLRRGWEQRRFLCHWGCSPKRSRITATTSSSDSSCTSTVPRWMRFKRLPSKMSRPSAWCLTSSSFCTKIASGWVELR